MKYRGFDAKRDANEGLIVDAFEAAGCSVLRTNKPLDLIVSYRWINWLVEVKDVRNKRGDAKSLTADQEEFFEHWPGGKSIVTTPEQAIEVANGLKQISKAMSGFALTFLEDADNQNKTALVKLQPRKQEFFE